MTSQDEKQLYIVSMNDRYKFNPQQENIVLYNWRAKTKCDDVRYWWLILSEQTPQHEGERLGESKKPYFAVCAMTDNDEKYFHHDTSAGALSELYYGDEIRADLSQQLDGKSIDNIFNLRSV